MWSEQQLQARVCLLHDCVMYIKKKFWEYQHRPAGINRVAIFDQLNGKPLSVGAGEWSAW